MSVDDSTREDEGLCDFFKNLGKSSAEAGKKLATSL